MSLLQRALDRAENPGSDDLPQTEILSITPENSSVKEKNSMPLMPLTQLIENPVETKHESPRLNTLRFYESQNQAVEEAIHETVINAPEIRPDEPKNAGRNFLGLILLLLILSFGAVRFILPSADKPQTPETVKTSSVTPAPAPVIVKTTKSFYSKPVSQAKFLLTGITASGDTDLAVINNQVVGTGDKLREGATVMSISGNRVVLDLNGKQIVLNF